MCKGPAYKKNHFIFQGQSGLKRGQRYEVRDDAEEGGRHQSMKHFVGHLNTVGDA